MHIIIDADPIVYRAGFAAETHSYDCVIEWPDGRLEQKYFAPMPNNTAGDQMKAFFKENDSVELLSKEKVVDCEPLAFALRGVKLTIQACINDAQRELGKRLMPGNKVIVPTVTVLLSGPGNFRDDIATIKKYKGNRDAAAKPVYYPDIREYLVDHWDAQVIEGHEADDECSILARMHADENTYCVCTIDKDLDQIPGHHYDYAKKVFYTVLPEEGRYLFWRQTLSGDSVDNIQGMYRVGDSSAEALLRVWLDDANGKTFSEISTVDDYLWDRAVAAYEANMEKYPDKFPEGMTAAEAALETARLVNMQEYRGQLWTPPHLPDEETT